jgi:hypothetical protein
MHQIIYLLFAIPIFFKTYYAYMYKSRKIWENDYFETYLWIFETYIPIKNLRNCL